MRVVQELLGHAERRHHPGLHAGDRAAAARGVLHGPPAGARDQEGLRVIEPAKLAELREALEEQRENLRKEIAEQGGDPDSDDAVDRGRTWVRGQRPLGGRTRPGLLSVMKALRANQRWVNRALKQDGRSARTACASGAATRSRSSASRRCRGRSCASTALTWARVAEVTTDAGGTPKVPRVLVLVCDSFGVGGRAGRRRRTATRVRTRSATRPRAVGGIHAPNLGALGLGHADRGSRASSRAPNPAPRTAGSPSVRRARTPRPGTGR